MSASDDEMNNARNFYYFFAGYKYDIMEDKESSRMKNLREGLY